MPAHIARTGDGNIIGIGDGGDLQEILQLPYKFQYKLQ
jgi:hypothetical protein